MSTAVIFDVDGTLVDSVDLHAEAWRQAFLAFGKQVSFSAIRQQIGKGGDQLLPVFLTKAEVELFGDELETHRGKLFRVDFLQKVRAFPRVRELFRRLIDDGKKLAVASSAKGKELETYLKLADISDLVKIRVSADDVEKSKPHPDLFQVALQRLDVSGPDAAVVGDTPYDAQAAERAGIPPVGVLSGGFPREELTEAGCREIYRDPADLLFRYRDGVLGG